MLSSGVKEVILVQYKIDSFIFVFMSMLIQILTQGSLMADVLKQNVECLKELYANITSRLLTQNVQEEGKHILLQEKAECANKCQINFIAFLFYSTINFCFPNECNERKNNLYCMLLFNNLARQLDCYYPVIKSHRFILKFDHMNKSAGWHMTRPISSCGQVLVVEKAIQDCTPVTDCSHSSGQHRS